MSTFITNDKQKTLKERLVTCIENSCELKFLVGFFYFSGISELYETLKKLYEDRELGRGHLKILVGLNVDEGAYGIYEVAKRNSSFSPNSLKEDFFNSIKTTFNSKELDKKEIYEQAEFFIKLLEEGIIELRKTRHPNHAKLYLFKLDGPAGEITPHLFITGSSNLTRAGLEGQDEFNVEIKDYGFEDAENYFDNLWDQAIALDDNDVHKLVKILKQESFLKPITPFEAYVYLLKTYIELHKGKISTKSLENLLKEKGYRVYSYQLDAVSQGFANCLSHGGTILADVAGLGKTVIACLIAKLLNKRRLVKRGLVICPPHLVGDENKTSGWKKSLEDFKLSDWEVRSLGKLEETLEFVQNHSDIKVVIVDEAHRFRNERTQSYHYLREICRGKVVILLSATPFNNRPKDIFALVKLFNMPKKSTITLDGDLESRFLHYESEFKKLAYIKKHHDSKDPKKKERALAYYKSLFGENTINLIKVKIRTKNLAREIRAILEPVVIRRNRLDLKFYGEEIPLTEVENPREWFFELTDEQLAFYDEVIEAFKSFEEGGKFKGAIYMPTKYEKGISEWIEIPEEAEPYKLSEEENFLYVYQINLYDFMRRLLVKRFESSFGAFKQSVKRFKEINQKALDFVNKTKKFILDRKLMEDLIEEDIETIEEQLKRYEEALEKDEINKRFHKVYDLSKFKEREKFIRDIENDLRLFEELERRIDEVGLASNDPKAERLVRGIKTFLKEKRKVVIFTEYLDTAKYLETILKKNFGNRVLAPFGNVSKATIEAIHRNFNAQYQLQEDEYDILLATDKHSEGFDLNRAGVVINYDIPWNPVRVIQRVGRINRIGKKVYDTIYIVNFFPTERGADIVKQREIAATKMFMIHNILGEDAKIFDLDEEPQPSELYKRLNTYSEGEEESFLTKLRKTYDELIASHPELKEALKDMPKRIKVAKKGEKDEILVFVKKGEDLFVGYKSYEEDKPYAVSFEEVYEKIVATGEDQALPLSKAFWNNYIAVLEKANYKPYSTNSSNNLSNKGIYLLKTLRQRNSESLKPYDNFIDSLLKDLTDYGTLSEYAISKIVEWEKYLNDEKKLIKAIEELKREIGEDFLKKAEKPIKGILEKEVVIVAIENQKVEGEI